MPVNQPSNLESRGNEFSRPDDEGGLRAPPGLKGWRKAWWWFDFIILVKLARLRFIAILAVIGVVITQWDLLVAHYERWTRPAADTAAGSGEFEWFCPMHPAVVRDNAKDKCPVCFMPLSKRKKGETSEEALPAGVVNRVQLSPYRVVLAGVQTVKVDFVPLTREITAVGYVEFNERGLRNVSARVKGRIDALYVNETGQMVDAGDELASLYSPELLVTVGNLVEARRSNSMALLNSARTRLQLLGISDDQIDDIVKTGKANTHLKIRTPITGHIIKKYVREGQYVDEGTPLYDVADLSSVWIEAQVYEDDLVFLPTDQAHKHEKSGPVGLPVTATTRMFPNEPFHGNLTFIYPHVDQSTRTARVRFELENPGHKLRPGSTATVTLNIAPKDIGLFTRAAADPASAVKQDQLDLGLMLALPESSIIDTGTETIAYRQALPGVFEGVRVELGPKMSGPERVVYYPVLRGLAPGDEVVTAGSFLVDAETRLNPATGSIYFGGSSSSKSGSGGVTPARPSTPEDESAKQNAALASLGPADRARAEAQRFCPVLSDNELGSMGVPIKLIIEGEPVFLCCRGCRKGALASAQETLAKVRKLKEANAASPQKPTGPPAAAPLAADPDAKVKKTLAKLPAADRSLAEAQRFCAVLSKSRLGSMGVPVKIMVDGKPVFLCCDDCRDEALANPQETIRKVEKLKSAGGTARN